MGWGGGCVVYILFSLSLPVGLRVPAFSMFFIDVFMFGRYSSQHNNIAYIENLVNS